MSDINVFGDAESHVAQLITVMVLNKEKNKSQFPF
jgi:hypothetical protein